MASPVVLGPKRDGSLRFCVDYIKLNAITSKDVFPLPRIDDILDTLGGTRYFTSLDLASEYWQIELDDDAHVKSAFTTYNGLYKFTRMPFGLCNAPATFQRVMQAVLVGLEAESVFVYLDDILVASKSFSQHTKQLKVVFERLRAAGLRLKPGKCFFLRDKVTYLGHVISAKGIQPDPAKTRKVESFPVPTDITEVRQFFGLASYYRWFIPDFASVAAPLHTLTRENVPFEWITDCQAVFDQLKHLLISVPVLPYPQFGPDAEFILETDASGVGLGAVLSQEQEDGQMHPIAYASRALDTSERNYGITELETLAVVWAARHFRPYLLGHHTTVFTDHSAYVSVLTTARPSGKLARWAHTIQELNLTLKHCTGKLNANADALSRIPVTGSRFSVAGSQTDHAISFQGSDAGTSEDVDPVGDNARVSVNPPVLALPSHPTPSAARNTGRVSDDDRSSDVKCRMEVLMNWMILMEIIFVVVMPMSSLLM